MHQIKRTAIVSYSARQMYELVNDIESYSRFLPWCSRSVIKEKQPETMIAELDIAWGGMHKSFMTKNTLTPYQSIDISLVHGPFKHLQGHWHFMALEEHACKIILALDFAFSGSWIDALFQPVFNHIANTLVDSFCKRATELYNHDKID